MDETAQIRAEIKEEADGIAWQSGEVPEVALYDALYHLEQIGLTPNAVEQRLLEEAVTRRYWDMVQRDLQWENLVESFFRGPARAWVNWQRLRKYALHHGFPLEYYREEAARLLRSYLAIEHQAVKSGQDYHTMGLGTVELLEFARELGLEQSFEADIIDLGSVRSLDYQAAITAGRQAAARTEPPQ